MAAAALSGLHVEDELLVAQCHGFGALLLVTNWYFKRKSLFVPFFQRSSRATPFEFGVARLTSTSQLLATELSPQVCSWQAGSL